MKTNIVIDISQPISYMAKFWVSSYGPKCCQPVKLQDSLKCKYLDKEVNDDLFFWHPDKHQSLLQVNTITLGVCNQAGRKYPKQACISLQYFQKNMEDEVDFLLADKNKSFLRFDCITLGVHSQACPKYPKQQVYNIFAIS